MSVVYETGRLNLFVPDVKCADAPFTEVRPQKPLFWFYARKFEKR